MVLWQNKTELGTGTPSNTHNSYESPVEAFWLLSLGVDYISQPRRRRRRRPAVFTRTVAVVAAAADDISASRLRHRWLTIPSPLPTPPPNGLTSPVTPINPFPLITSFDDNLSYTGPFRSFIVVCELGHNAGILLLKCLRRSRNNVAPNLFCLYILYSMYIKPYRIRNI